MKKWLLIAIAFAFLFSVAFAEIRDFPPAKFEESLNNIIEIHSIYRQNETNTLLDWRALGYGSEGEFRTALAAHPERFDVDTLLVDPKIYELTDKMKPVYKDFYEAFESSDLEKIEKNYPLLLAYLDELKGLVHESISFEGLRIQFMKMVNSVRNRHVKTTITGDTPSTGSTVVGTYVNSGTKEKIDSDKLREETKEKIAQREKKGFFDFVMLLVFVFLIAAVGLFVAKFIVRR